MKFEDEPMFFESTLSDKPSSKADDLQSERSKIENEENHDQIVSGLNGDMNLDDHSECSIKDENGWSPFKEDSSSIDSSDKDDVKAVDLIEFDPPKSMAFFQESSCDIVKDICMDERTNSGSSLVKVEIDENEDVRDDVLVDELEISEEISLEKESIDQTDINEFILAMVVECDKNDLNAKPNVEIEPCDDDNNDAVQEHSVEISEIEKFSNDPTISAREVSKNVFEKLPSTKRGPEDDDVTKGSLSEAKSEKIGLESGKLSAFEDGLSSQTQIGIGESSFSTAAPLASLINYAGPVTNSGNLSIRSDSSTTSTRSFAFPILQTEWHHNSPVRMAEADRRFFRRHKGWRQGIFCCRF